MTLNTKASQQQNTQIEFWQKSRNLAQVENDLLFLFSECFSDSILESFSFHRFAQNLPSFYCATKISPLVEYLKIFYVL